MSGMAIDSAIEVCLPEMPLGKFEREKRAFVRLLPRLLETHAGQYVAIHDEQVVDSGTDQAEVALRVQKRFGAAPIYVHLVANSTPSFRSGVIRDLSRRESNP